MQQDEDLKEKKNKKKHENKSVTKDSVSDNTEEENNIKPEKNKKLLFIIVSVVVFLCVLIGVFFLTPLADWMLGASDPDANKRKLEATEAQAVTYLPLPELTINLKKANGGSRTLTASFDLALKNEDMRKNVNNFVPVIQDQFNGFLREMTESDLEGIVGLERVSQEMLMRINRVVAPFCVQAVLIKNFYIR